MLLTVDSIKNGEQEIPMSEILHLRQWVYQFLGRSYYAGPVLEEFQELARSNPFQSLAVEAEGSQEGIRYLTDYFEKIPSLNTEGWINLLEEYQRLFIGPQELPAHPWESVHLSLQHIILDEHTLAVRKFYREWGVEVILNDPDDHVGLELEFIAHLIGKGLEYLNQGDLTGLKNVLLAQKTFLNDHLLRWVREYCNQLANSTEHPFYRGIALFTPDYLESDLDFIDELVSCLEKNNTMKEG